MKRLLVLFISLLVVLNCVVFSTNAKTIDNDSSTVSTLVYEAAKVLDDGAMIAISIYEDLVLTRSNLYNKSGQKVYNYWNADGELLWTFTVSGEFRIIEGASVTCISANCSADVYQSSWSCTRKSAIPSGSFAIGEGVFTEKLLGIVVATKTVNVSLACDVYGNFS